MSRKFNGTSQAMSVAIDLSAYAQVSISCWLWWDTFANNDKLLFEYSANSNSAEAFAVDPNSTSPANGLFSVDMHHTGAYWQDSFTRPSAAVWHHYVFTFNRATPLNQVYIDGAIQSLTTVLHNASTYGNFANTTLYFMSRAGTSLFAAGRMAEFALWGGTILTAREALALSSGSSPTHIGPMPTFYWPLWGDSPEPDYGGTRKSLTLTGTPTIVAHPPVQPPRVRSRYSYSG